MLRILDRVVEGTAVLAFAVSSLLICINVVNRYLILGFLRTTAGDNEWLQPVYLFLREAFGSVSVTADEVPGLLLVWVAFLGAYLTMRRKGHISFDLLADSLPAPLRKAVALINSLIIAGFLLVLLWQSIRMIRVSGRTEIETAEIAQGWFMLILPLTAVLLLLALATQLRAALDPKNGDR